MKKKLILSIVLCMLAIFAFSVIVSAEDTACEHKYDDWTVTLGENGFLGEITASAKCVTCKATKTEIIPKIFITKGYSNSSDGVMQDYGVNREALAKYEQLSGEALKFGAVVALKESIGGKNPLDNKGEPISSKVRTFDYTDTEYSVISVAIKGIPEDAKTSSGLLCALYVNAGGRTTYLDNCAEKVACGTKTFNEIEAVPEKDETKLEKVEIIDGTRYHQMTATEMGLQAGKFWQYSSIQTSANLTKNFFATKEFKQNTLPVGSIITIASEDGWQYRPHKWSGTRPDTTKETYVKVTEEWWGDFTSVGFNISMDKDMVGANNTINGLDDISAYTLEQISQVFRIYVPVTYVDDTTGGDNEGGTTEPETPVNPPVDPNPGEGGNEGGTTDPNPGEGDDVIVPELPDYSAVKQNWQDDGELKILAIGNSFSDDAMEHVYQVAKDAGVEKIKLGNMFIGGCSLATHLSNAKNNKGAYTYRTNENGTWTSVNSVSIKTAVESDDWDFITFQQVSGNSGVADTYNDLYELIKIVEPLNPSARLAWHMTWAYQKNSGHSDFGKYDKDQMKMYNAIVNAVNTKILTIDNIEIVIPSGTAIQNVRTSFIGDTLTRDGYHLSYGIGRYIASMTYVKALTGLSIDNSITCPDDVSSYELKAIIESVNNAIDTPYAVTNSSYPTKDATQGGDDSENYGVIPEGFVQLTATQMGLTAASYYNTQGSSAWDAPEDSWARCFVATKKFTREELPVGSVIEIAVGWQYRPEGWAFANSRPENVTTLRIIVDEDWWGSYTERGFNISQVGNSTNNHKEIALKTTEIANTIFRIYVPASVAPDVEKPETPVNPPVDPTPGEGGNEGGTTDPNPDEGGTTEPETPEVTTGFIKSSDCVTDVTVIDGKEYRALTMKAMGLIKNAYYYSDKAGPVIYETGTSGTPANYYATKIFTDEYLVDGAVIWVNNNWQYRPEGWDDSNNSPGSRPGNVNTTYVTVDDSWWGSFTQRGFNISNGNSLVNVDSSTIYENFKIYIPVDKIAD